MLARMSSFFVSSRDVILFLRIANGLFFLTAYALLVITKVMLLVYCIMHSEMLSSLVYYLLWNNCDTVNSTAA